MEIEREIKKVDLKQNFNKFYKCTKYMISWYVS